MSTHTQPITADQLLRMPDNNMRRELIAGELREMAPAGFEHGCVTIEFALPLGFHVKQNALGKVCTAETGFILSRNPDTVRAPDIAFVSTERLTLAKPEQGFFPGAPDLAVEVLSPGDSKAEVEAKAEDWLAAGCRMVVLVNSRNRTLKVYRTQTDVVVLTAKDVFDGGDIVPGFRLAVESIFGQKMA